MARRHALGAATALAVSVSGCVSTSMQGYADRDLPSRPVSHIAALVVAPMPLATAMQSSLMSEASKRGVAIEDARTLFPPTRQYTNAEIKHDLIAHGVDGVLVINVGDSGVQQQYAGTIFSGGYSGGASGSGLVNSFGAMSTTSYSATVSGSSYATATPVYRYRRQTDFTARLIDPVSDRNLWVGNGQVNASGSFFVGNNVSASNSAAAIFKDLQAKGIIIASR